MMPMDPKSMMEKCMIMMGQAGIPEEKIERWKAMMQTPVANDSPGAIYHKAEALGLTEEQKKQLQDIETETREKALAVLTAEQREQLGKTPTAPEPMMNMCKEMMPKMMEMMQGMMSGDPSKKGDDKPGSCGKETEA